MRATLRVHQEQIDTNVIRKVNHYSFMRTYLSETFSYNLFIDMRFTLLPR